MEEKIKNKLRIKFGIDNDYENYRGVHYYEDIAISNILPDEVTGEFTVHFDHVLKTVTEDEYGNDLGAWNDKTERTSMVATFNEKFEILSIA